MRAEIKGMLVASLEALRSDDGVTTEKLRGHSFLLQMLGASTPEEGKKKLDELVLSMGDGFVARATRNALVIGDEIEPRGGPEARRKWATDPTKGKDGFLPRSRSTHIRYEERGFTEIAQVIIDRQKVNVSHDPVTEEGAVVRTPSTETLPREATRSGEADWAALRRYEAREVKTADRYLKLISLILLVPYLVYFGVLAFTYVNHPHVGAMIAAGVLTLPMIWYVHLCFTWDGPRFVFSLWFWDED